MDKNQAKQAIIRIAYTGPGVQGGVMEGRSFANSVRALCTMTDQANLILNEKQHEMSVQVQNIKEGSFLFELALQLVEHGLQSFPEFQLLPDLSPENIIDILGLGKRGVGVLARYKQARGRKPKSINQTDGGEISIDFGDNQPMVMSKHEFILYKDRTIRKSIKKMVSPVASNKGITSVQVRSLEGAILEIGRKEISYYAMRIGLPIERELPSPVRLRLVTVQLEDELRKWSFRCEDNDEISDDEISAKIVDREFHIKLSKGEESFTQGDDIVAKLRVRMWENNEKPTEYEVLKVIQHIKGGQ